MVTVLVIDILRESQPLTVELVELGPGKELQDASDRNETLVVAASPLQLRAVYNLGDESTWVPSRVEVLKLKSNTAAWMRPGTYHLKNLLQTSCSFVTVKW